MAEDLRKTGMARELGALKPSVAKLPWGDDPHKNSSADFGGVRVGLTLSREMYLMLEKIRLDRKLDQCKPSTMGGMIREALHVALLHNALESRQWATGGDDE